MRDEPAQPRTPEPADTPSSPVPAAEHETTPTVSRRGLLFGAGGLVVGAAVGATAGAGIRGVIDGGTGSDQVDLGASHPFYGPGHQAGIQTPPQQHTVYMAYDLVPGTTAVALQTLLARWSAAIAQLMQGKTIGAVQPDRPDAVAPDTGEAFDLSPAGLTVTVGLGPGVFDDRFGLASKKPKLLAELPALPSDQLQPGLTGGDLSLQACADDPQVAYHAIRDLSRIAKGVATTRWTVMGFGRASAGAGQTTPRNLMGFKDGTRNLKSDDEIAQHVWVTDDQPWARDGAYQVVRKIQMHIETWDTDKIGDQQTVFGRSKQEGAPLSGTREFDTPDFSAVGADGTRAIDPTSHVSLAAFENNGGVRILRRGYNYTDGLNEYGMLDAGLLFICYMNDPQSFIALQTKLGSSDRLNEYIAHIGSAIFFTPAAPAQGGYLAQGLFS